MNEDTTDRPGNDAGHPPEADPSQEVTRQEEDEHQEKGRAAMDRWSLHKAFMEDLEWELEAKKTSDRKPSGPDSTGSSHPSVP